MTGSIDLLWDFLLRPLRPRSGGLGAERGLSVCAGRGGQEAEGVEGGHDAARGHRRRAAGLGPCQVGPLRTSILRRRDFEPLPGA